MAGAQHHLLLPESIPALAAEPAERLRSPARLGMAAILEFFFSSRKLKHFLLQPQLMLAERVLQSHRFLFSGRGGASRHLAARQFVCSYFFFIFFLMHLSVLHCQP